MTTDLTSGMTELCFLDTTVNSGIFSHENIKKEIKTLATFLCYLESSAVENGLAQVSIANKNLFQSEMGRIENNCDMCD